MIDNNLKIYIRKKLEEMCYGFNILQGYFTSKGCLKKTATFEIIIYDLNGDQI